MRLPAGFIPLCLISFCFCTLEVKGQYYILGRGLDEEEVPYAYAKAELHGEGMTREQTCTELGVFRFEDLKSGSYEVVLVTPYGIRRKKIELRGSIDVSLHIPRNIQIDEISVVARKAGDQEPVTHQNISREQLQSNDTGQDLPYLLAGSPSVVVTSDAGHGIGYTGLRIRGTDPTRIGVTLNGIPVNDAESHNVFWVDLPDVASSTSDIQIQRGIGWSQPGSGDLGAGIHLNTLGFNHDPYAGIILGIGSFNTQRATLHAGSGLLKGRFTLDGRGTYMHSDGFIDRSASDLYSAYVSAGYHHDLTNIRMIYMLGDELTQQAWNGVPEQYILLPHQRTYNSAGEEKDYNDPYDNEVDDYTQQHFQFHFDQSLTPFARWTNALHYTKGKGFFEQYKSNQNLLDYGLDSVAILSDLIRQRWLNNDYYGFISTLQIGRPMERYLVLGGGWNQYNGEHFGNVIWTEKDGGFFSPKQYYFNKAVKRDWNIFGRSNLKISESLHTIIDLQGRWIQYTFEGPDENGNLQDQEVRHRFFNPKLGMHYTLSDKHAFYALTGLISKEPNRDDYVNSTKVSRPSSERLWDTEIGWRYTAKNVQAEITGYHMAYNDQLVLTGRINDVGAYTRINVDKSYRTGVESSASVQPFASFVIKGNITLSKNIIDRFDEYIDNWTTGEQEIVTHEKTDIAFSPGTIAGIQAAYQLFEKSEHQFTITLGGKYIGRQYVDNTSRDASLLDAYALADAGLEWKWKSLWAQEFSVRFFVKNLFNEQYESNGWIYRFRWHNDPVPDDPYAGEEGQGENLYHQKGYFPQAGRHMFLQLAVTF